MTELLGDFTDLRGLVREWPALVCGFEQQRSSRADAAPPAAANSRCSRA
jgi:hypothetical protein